MAGDLVAGIALSQIVYWHLPSKQGKPRLQVERHGHRWLAKARREWWDECRLSPKQADRALKALRKRGLIEIRILKFAGAPTKHVRVLQDAFLAKWRNYLTTSILDQTAAQAEHRAIFPKGQIRIRPKVKMDLPQSGMPIYPEGSKPIVQRLQQRLQQHQQQPRALLTRMLMLHLSKN